MSEPPLTNRNATSDTFSVNHHFDRLLQLWATHQYAQSLAKRTVRERARTLHQLAREMDGDPVSMGVDDILEWLAEAPSDSSRVTYHRNLHAWYLWLKRCGHRLDNPLEGVKAPKLPRRKPHPVPVSGIIRMLQQRMHFNTRAYILLAFLQGLRVHEVAKHRGEYIDHDAQTLRVIGKGGVDWTVPLHPVIAELAEHFPRTGYWFPSHTRRGHVTGQAVGERVKAVMVRAGVAGSAHHLRHSFGTQLHRNGVDLLLIKELMRHASIQSTQIYVEPDESALHRAIRLVQADTADAQVIPMRALPASSGEPDAA